MNDQPADTLSRLQHLEGTDFLFSPEYALCVQPTDRGYKVFAHPVSYDEDLSYENLFLGGRTPVTISDGLSEEELDALFDLIDKDLAHAMEWMARDAVDGHLGDVEEIVGWQTLRSRDPVDYMLYLSGVGDEARNFTNAEGPSEEAAAKYFAYLEERAASGVLAKGQPQYANGVSSGEAMFAYDAALETALDRWIAEGNLVAAVRAARP